MGDDWEGWSIMMEKKKFKFVAEIGRMHIIDAQVELLRRLGVAARLQEPEPDPRSATAEQAKGMA